MCKHEWCVDLTTGGAAEMAESNSMDTATFILRLEQVRQHQPPSKVLLVFYEGTSHLDMNTVISTSAHNDNFFVFQAIQHKNGSQCIRQFETI
jgi:hypothetical protein